MYDPRTHLQVSDSTEPGNTAGFTHGPTYFTCLYSPSPVTSRHFTHKHCLFYFTFLYTPRFLSLYIYIISIHLTISFPLRPFTSASLFLNYACNHLGIIWNFIFSHIFYHISSNLFFIHVIKVNSRMVPPPPFSIYQQKASSIEVYFH